MKRLSKKQLKAIHAKNYVTLSVMENKSDLGKDQLERSKNE